MTRSRRPARKHTGMSRGPGVRSSERMKPLARRTVHAMTSRLPYDQYGVAPKFTVDVRETFRLSSGTWFVASFSM
jgi:hypothetical protein